MTSDKRKGRTPPANRHDTLFRAILEDPDRAATLIREYLPTDIRKLLSDEPPRLVDGTFVDEAMRTSQSDHPESTPQSLTTEKSEIYYSVVTETYNEY